MNTVAGYVPVVIGGESRTLVCDMNAGECLFQSEGIGEHWTIWLIERFVGRPESDGKKLKFNLPPLPPSELAEAVYALLATDREDSGRAESAKDIRRSIAPSQVAEIQQAATKAVFASFGAPGKGAEVVAGASASPR